MSRQEFSDHSAGMSVLDQIAVYASADESMVNVRHPSPHLC
ncbi:hypothetical protein GMO_12410 [Gluconobacter morbifer G707]|uniref:Uncharacterized protein n=1 Tax=Gluconobacter morbifer G707 TaxID=1088869 RepID=G6XI31_9PROT|nr:hypothetical protein GMO_12410 [Gluconobacter morbifer G707]